MKKATIAREAAALALFGALVVMAIALAGYEQSDPSWNHATHRPPANPAGVLGAYLADALYQLLGWGAWVLWGLLLVCAVRIAFAKHPYCGGGFAWAWLACLWFLCGLLAAMHPESGLPAGAGGALGGWLVQGIRPFVEGLALKLLLALLALSAFVAASGISLLHMAARARAVWRDLWARRREERAVAAQGPSQTAQVATQPDPAPPMAPAEDEATQTKPVPQRPKRRVPPPPAATEHWQFPPLDLFDEPKGRVRISSSRLAELAKRLESTLADYRVEGKVVAVQPGPVVTRFEFEPAPGTKLARVVALQDDLARALQVASVRVAGNVPGKNAIGIEVPNEQREIVPLKRVLASPAFADRNLRLPLALGVDIAGAPVVVDLAKMPHLLVAGTTGSGKSVSINAMLCSLLMRHPPEALRLILVDPKMLELSVYADVPHLLAPVVVDPHKAAKALAWAVFEMERRYRLMSEAKVRNIAGYNAFVDRWRPAKEGERPPERLPMIVIVIDELADLMMVAGKEVEQSICRIAQKARAAGIHLILATQRPSVDVITGLIKANLPSRLAFQVSSRVDSRTILDQMGAEQLLGYGDGLLLLGGRELVRVHGAFVSDQEVQRFADFLRAQRAAEYLAEDLSPPQEEEQGGGLVPDEDDPLYDQAVALVVEKGKCSVSMVQRFLRIGYNRASRLVERMEKEGIVSPPGAGGLRQVLAPREGRGVDG